MSQAKHRELTRASQSHTASEQWSRDLNPGVDSGLLGLSVKPEVLSSIECWPLGSLTV